MPLSGLQTSERNFPIGMRRRFRKSNVVTRLTIRITLAKKGADRWERVQQNYLTKTERIDKTAKFSAAAKELASASVKNLAGSALVSAGYAGANAALLAMPVASAVVAAPALSGALAIAGAGIGASNVYRTYQALRNTYSIATSDPNWWKARK